jgi:2-ketoarginine methyltransferase
VEDTLLPIRESTLVTALEPFHGFVLSMAIFAMHKSGLASQLADGATLGELAGDGRRDLERLTAMLDYLRAVGLVTCDEGTFKLTELARIYGAAGAWYEMMVGGYGMTFLALADHLDAGTPGAPRVGRYVGSGSCGISMHDSVPLVRRLLALSGRKYKRLIDLGCGSGVYLTELCADYPGLLATGIEPDADAVAAARQWVSGQPTADRVTIEQAGALEWIARTPDQPDLAVLAFVIHEILGQQGEDGVRRLLLSLFDAAPGLDLVVIDVDLRSADLAAMTHPLARSYYNAYFLLHPFTDQRLMPREWWERLFADCGLTVAYSGTTDPATDSTGFEVGWLLRRC